jgi:very-short-patch-repair endonuclease
MAGSTVQSSRSGAWALAESQHGVVSRKQLLELGFSRHAIEHRLAEGRLHPVFRAVYAVGRPQLSRHGHWMAAVLACGDGTVLSHADAGALWEIRPHPHGPIHVSVPLRRRGRDRAGIVIHRRKGLTEDDITELHGIPVTTPIATLIDIAPSLSRDQLEAATNEADKRGLTDPDQLRRSLDEVVQRPGTAILKQTLDHHTFTLTDSQLERRFLRLVREAGLPRPQTGQRLNGYKVDFYWPELGLVVETDGLRYHRTPAQQARDRERDQAHAAAGLTTLRFTHAQVSRVPDQVRSTLRAVARRHR